jgi:predicted site-specific integrase-resolvase
MKKVLFILMKKRKKTRFRTTLFFIFMQKDSTELVLHSRQEEDSQEDLTEIEMHSRQEEQE